MFSATINYEKIHCDGSLHGAKHIGTTCRQCSACQLLASMHRCSFDCCQNLKASKASQYTTACKYAVRFVLDLFASWRSAASCVCQ